MMYSYIGSEQIELKIQVFATENLDFLDSRDAAILWSTDWIGQQSRVSMCHFRKYQRRSVERVKEFATTRF